MAFEINGDKEHSLPHVLNLYFPGVSVEALLVNLDMAGGGGSPRAALLCQPFDNVGHMFGSSFHLLSRIAEAEADSNRGRQPVTLCQTADIIRRLSNWSE